MTEIDYALTWDFIDPADGKPRQLRFRRNFAPRNDPRIFDGAGQLVAVVADGHRSDNAMKSPSAGPASYSTTSKPPTLAGKSGPPCTSQTTASTTQSTSPASGRKA